MAEDRFEHIRSRYQDLRRQLDAGQISQTEFSERIQSLQVQDESGTWWTIHPDDGLFYRYDGSQWIADTPHELVAKEKQTRPLVNKIDDSAKTTQPAFRIKPETASRLGKISLLIPILAGTCWFLYANVLVILQAQISGEKEAGRDLFTSLFLCTIPLALIFFAKPIDRLLVPIQPYRQRFPKPFLFGAAIGIPILFALCSSTLLLYLGGETYVCNSLTILSSMIIAYVLTRDPQVKSNEQI